MARRVWRVSPTGAGWRVRRDGATRATRICARKRDAVAVARRLARQHEPSRVVIHRPDGTIEDHAEYGEADGLSYAGTFEGPADLGTRSEKYLAEHFSGPDAGS